MGVQDGGHSENFRKLNTIKQTYLSYKRKLIVKVYSKLNAKIAIKL